MSLLQETLINTNIYTSVKFQSNFCVIFYDSLNSRSENEFSSRVNKNLIFKYQIYNVRIFFAA